MRSAPSAAPGASGNDPLAELARLIGQNDPFAEYGRDGRHPAPQAAAPESRVAAYADERYAPPPPPAPPPAQRADYGVSDAYPHPQQAYGTAPAAYLARGQAPSYPPEAGYDQHADYPTSAHSGAEDHDVYDDVPPRRRMGILAIAAVFALAVVGTAGAFGYRAIFGSSGSNTPPPVIKADSAPTKIVPAASSKDPKSGKLIYDRVADRAQGEKLVSREEQPLAMKDKPAGMVMPPGQNGMQPVLGSGVVATEPKKVHTIAIRPDGTAMADAASAAHAAAAAAPPAHAVQAQAAARAPAAEPAPRQAVARAEPAPRRNAPLSLSPNAPAQAAPAPRTVHTAAVAAPTQIAPASAAPARAAPVHGGGYAVQVSSQRSEAEAQAAFHNLQAKFPGQLGGKQPLIHRVDLGAKGIYFRAMVGPFGSSEEAGQLCANLKAAGGQCIVQRN